MAGITHTTAATGTDSGDGKISKNAWNESHSIDYIEFPEISKPSSPSSGKARLFVGTDGYLYLLASDGNEVPVSGIVGAGSSATIVGTMEATGSSPLTLTKPAGTTDGDLMIIACQTANSTPNAAGPDGSGWTNWISYDTSSSEYQVIWWKIASSEGSSWTLTHSAGSDAAAAGIVIRGAPDVWFMGANMDDPSSPHGVGHPLGLQVCIWMTTTGGTGDLKAPIGAGITTDVDVTYAGGNYSAVTIAHRKTHSAWDCPPLMSWNRNAPTYVMGFVVVLYDNGS